MLFISLLICAVCTWDTSESARILAIVPTASFSHQVFFRPFWRELCHRGHDVVLITTDPIRDPTIKNLKEIDLSAAYSKWNSSIMDVVNMNEDKLAAVKVMIDVMFNIADLELSNPEVQALYHSQNEHFDLLIMEYLLPTMFAFKHKFNVPFIGVTSLDAPIMGHIAVGNPIQNILYPNFMLGFGDKLSFWERIIATVFDAYMFYWGFTYFNPKFNELITKHLGEGIPDFGQIGYEVDMIFANSNPLFNPVRPHSPATISIAGGLHEVALKPLPKDLNDFMDDATEGVIYFSLGSNVKSKEISSKTRETIMKAFAQLPYKILWKFEDEELPGKPKNVKIMKWLPQQDVLRHKNILVFVTQGGLQSLEESLFARVPVVVMPFFADQESNARHAIHKGLGLTVDHKTLTVEEFKAALTEVISNDKYRKKVKEMADLIQDQPIKPLEKAVWWTEYVLRHKGAKHLHGAWIPFYQVLYLDVFAFLGTITVIFLGLIYYIVKKIGCCIKKFGTNSSIQKKQQ